MTKCFLDNTKLAIESISICCFSAVTQGPNFTPTSGHLDTGEKLIITSSVTKDVYIRPCISLTKHHMQYVRFKPGLFTSILVRRNAVFLIITSGWKDLMFQNEKFPGFVHPYNLLQCLQNKEICSNKTL